MKKFSTRSVVVRRRHARGFTLLEMVITITLLAMVTGMVMNTASLSLALGNRVIKSQEEEMLNHSLFDFLTNRFSSLPGNARLDLKSQDLGGNKFSSTLTLQNAPLSFGWNGAAKVAKAVQVVTVRQSNGFLKVVLRYFENEILAPESGDRARASALKEKPFAEIPLLEDVSYFEWRALDGRTMEHSYDWSETNRLPQQMELSLSVGAQGEDMRHVFPILPRVNPEVIARQMPSNATRPPAAAGPTAVSGTAPTTPTPLPPE